MIQVTHLRHAYRQAPWRIQRQWAGLFLLGLLVLAMISALYLDVTSNAAIAGREIQHLRIQITDTQRQNADLETQLASLLSTSSMETRAQELGFRPATPGEIQYLVVPGYFAPTGVSLERLSPAPVVTASIPPEYTQSLFDWFADFLSSPPSEMAGGVYP